jgi:hypothetical protein
MKKIFAMFLLTTMLISSTANAGILILTGDIGNKFEGYKVVGWVTIALTGVSLIGLVVDADQDVASNVKLPLLSEKSTALIHGATSKARQEASGSFITTINSDLASEIVALEGLEGSPEGSLLFRTLTEK